MAEAAFETFFKAARVDSELGVVFGWAIICKIAGKPYEDTQRNVIPEDAMLEAVDGFMKTDRALSEQHARIDSGEVRYSLPLTGEIAAALGITCDRTGWIVGVAPSPALLAKFKSGQLTEFSIGGRHLEIDGHAVE